MLVIFLMILLIIPGIYITLTGNKSKREKEAQQAKVAKKLYKFLSSFFVTQSTVANIYSKMASLSLYRREEMQVQSVKYLASSWLVGGIIIGFSFFMFSDMLTILICIVFAILVTSIVVDKLVDAQLYKVTKGLAHLLGSIRQEYMRYGSVVEALSEAQAPPLLKRPLEELSQILVSTNAELRLQEFCETTPFRTLQTLASICYHINNHGDEVDEKGQSNFVQALTLLVGDVNSDIQKTMYRKKRFGFIEYLAFIPFIGIGAMEMYFMDIMPGTALIYKGPLGYLFRTLTVLIAAISYVIVSRVNCSVPIKEDDRTSYIITMLEKPSIRRIVTNISPKNRARAKVERKLKKAISRMTVEQFYLKKLLTGGLAFVLALLCTVSTISLGRDFIQNSTQQLSLVATKELNQHQINAIRELDAKYLSDPDSFNNIQLTDMVSSALPGLSDLEIQDQIKRLKDKRKSLDNTYFHWWYVWVAVGVSFIGWLGPNIMLTIRMKLIETEEEDDFLQLQTLVSILMNTNIDTLDMLYQLAQHSRVHKDMFMHAYQGYPSNPEMELTRLQSKTPIMEFKRFVEKLKLSISEISLKEAYSDLLIEREHTMRMRDMVTRASIDRRRGFCGPLAMAPLGAMVIGTFLVPIGVLGYNEFMNALGSL